MTPARQAPSASKPGRVLARMGLQGASDQRVGTRLSVRAAVAPLVTLAASELLPLPVALPIALEPAALELGWYPVRDALSEAPKPDDDMDFFV